MPPDMEGIARESIGIVKEEEIVINGKEGVKITGKSMKDGSDEFIVMVEYDGWLYHFGGKEEFLDNLTTNFKFSGQ